MTLVFDQKNNRDKDPIVALIVKYKEKRRKDAEKAKLFGPTKTSRKQFNLIDMIRLKARNYRPTESELQSANETELPDIEDNFLELTETPFEFALAPQIIENNNFRIVVIAPSGSGKSTWVANFATSFLKTYPDYPCFLFSRHEKDPSIDVIPDLKRVQISDDDIIRASKYEDEPLPTLDNLANSLLIFDDCYDSKSRYLNKYWNELMADTAVNIRKYGSSCIYVLHNTDYKNTRLLMSEATHFVFFLQSGADQMYHRLLRSYLGYKDNQIDYLFDLDSRWVCFRRIAPQCILTQKQMFTNSLFKKI